MVPVLVTVVTAASTLRPCAPVVVPSKVPLLLKLFWVFVIWTAGVFEPVEVTVTVLPTLASMYCCDRLKLSQFVVGLVLATQVARAGDPVKANSAETSAAASIADHALFGE